MSDAAWRIVLITTVPPVADALVPVLRELGHEPVAILSARRATCRATAGRSLSHGRSATTIGSLA